MATATLISILPFHSEEYKPSIIPSIIEIPKCDDVDNPVFVSVEDRKYIEYIPLKGPRFNPVTGEDFAAAVVRDKLSAIFGRDPERGIMPGLTWVPGEFETLRALKAKHPMLHSKLKEDQTRWNENLVVLADDDWSKFKQHRLINDLQRNAAKVLGLKREWMIATQDRSNAECPVCFEIINAKALKCRFCQSILKPEAFAKVAVADTPVVEG